MIKRLYLLLLAACLMQSFVFAQSGMFSAAYAPRNISLYPTQNTVVDEARFLVNQPIDFVIQRLTKFYGYAQVKNKKKAAAFLQKHIWQELKSGMRKKDSVSEQMLQLMFSKQYLFEAADHTIACIGNPQGIFLMYLIYRDNADWKKARQIEEQIPLKMRRGEVKGANGKMYDWRGFEQYKDGMGYENQLTLTRRVYNKTSHVAVLTLKSSLFWNMGLSMLVYAIKEQKKGNQAFNSVFKEDKAAAGKVYERMVKQMAKPDKFITLIKEGSFYQNCLNVVGYISAKLSRKELAKMKVTIKGAKLVYNKPGVLYLIPQGNQPVKLTFRFKKLRETIVLQSVVVPAQNIAFECFRISKCEKPGKLLRFDLRDEPHKQLLLDFSHSTLPKKLYLSTYFYLYNEQERFGRRGRDNKTKKDDFHQMTHLLDCKLAPTKWRIKLKRKDKVIATRQIENKAEANLTTWQPLVQQDDSLIVELVELKRINYLNQPISQEVPKGGKQSYLLKPMPAPLPLLELNVQASPEAMHKQCKLGEAENVLFRKDLKGKNSHYTPLQMIKELRLSKNGKLLLKVENVYTFLQFSTDFFSDGQAYKLYQMFIKSFGEAGFQKVKRQLRTYLSHLMKNNPGWDVHPELKKKYPGKSFAQIYDKEVDFDKLFTKSERFEYNMIEKFAFKLANNQTTLQALMTYSGGGKTSVEIYFRQ